MLKTKEKSIGGHVWSVTEFPGRAGLRYGTRLARLLGPAFAQAVDGTEKDSKKSLLEREIKLGPAIEALVLRMDEGEVERLIMDLLSFTRCDGEELKPAVFDKVFAAKIHLLFQVLMFVVEVNFGGFTELAGNIGDLTGSAQLPQEASQDG